MKANSDYSVLSDEQLTAGATTVAHKLAELRGEVARLNELAQKFVVDQQAIADEISTRKLAASATIDWAWALADDPVNSAVRYKALTQAVRKLAQHESGHSGLTADSVNTHTGQHVPRVALLRGVPELTRRVQEGLEQLLPHMLVCTPGRSSQPIKYVAVFESTLSEFGGFYLAIEESLGIFELRKTSYGSGSACYSAQSLAELLHHVEQACYYEDGSDRITR